MNLSSGERKRRKEMAEAISEEAIQKAKDLFGKKKALELRSGEIFVHAGYRYRVLTRKETVQVTTLVIEIIRKEGE